MNITTNLNPRDYNEREVVRISNREQQTFYIDNRVFPVDMYSSINRLGKKIIAMIFLKEDTQEVYREWCANGGRDRG